MAGFFDKFFNEDRSEASFFSSVFSMFSAMACFCAIFNDQWLTIRPRTGRLIEDDALVFENNKEPIIPSCSRLGANIFWRLLRNQSLMDIYRPLRNESITTLDDDTNNIAWLPIHVNCVNQLVFNWLYVATCLCFLMAFYSVLSATLHSLLPKPKALDAIRRYFVFEILNVFLMLIVCIIVRYLKREIEQRAAAEAPSGAGDLIICFGTGMFYVVFAGLFSIVGALFAVYQRRLAGRTRRARNQTFICTRALRSWRDHVERSRLTAVVAGRPTELERYLLGAVDETAAYEDGLKEKRERSSRLYSDRPNIASTSTSGLQF